jgi:hypothetical protein
MVSGMPFHSLNMAAAIALALGGAMLSGCAASRRPEACSPLPDGSPRPVLVAPYRAGIVLDGDLADWEGIPFTSVTPATGIFDPGAARTDSPADLSFRFAVCHDDEALYVAVEVTDDIICVDSCLAGSTSCPAWSADAIEVFIDGNHSHAANSRLKDGSELAFGGEFALVANGAASSDYSGYPRTFGRRDTWQGATNWKAVLKGEKLVRYEFRITWNMMGGKVRSGDTIGFNISAQDSDGGGVRHHALYFCGNLPRLYSDERGFADLYLQPR